MVDEDGELSSEWIPAGTPGETIDYAMHLGSFFTLKNSTPTVGFIPTSGESATLTTRPPEVPSS